MKTPAHRGDAIAHPDRREFLRLMGASLAMSTASCLRRPTETIVPYAQAPEKIVPGKPLYYASALTLGGHAIGVLVESHEGRPTKIEGNPDHPASLGATDVFAQAQVLSLYDPDRSQSVLYRGLPASHDMFLEVIERELPKLQERAGQGLRILTETLTAPTLGNALQQLLVQLPRARWHQYEPLNRDNVHAGTKLAFGSPLSVRHNFEKARIVVSLDADFLACGPACIADARRFIEQRRIANGGTAMNRLYVVESGLSITGSNADHRLALPPRDVQIFAQALAARFLKTESQPQSLAISAKLGDWVGFLAQALQQHRGASIVMAGDDQPPFVHALCAALNHTLGNIGQTVEYTRPALIDAGSQSASLRELCLDIASGTVTTLIVLGANPVYSAPADLEFAQLLPRVPLRVHLGLYEDETARLCQWHLPQAHALESWSDARAFDGTASLVQPLIAPLYGGRSELELIALLQGQRERSPYEMLRDYWRTQLPAATFESTWAQSLQRGVIDGTTLPPETVVLQPANIREALSVIPAAMNGLTLRFAPDPTIWDGRFANSAWLQELPKPLSTLTWENVAQISPKSAQTLNLATGDVIEIGHRGRKIEAPVLIAPGMADDTVILTLGYGRSHAGRIGNGLGYNAYALRTLDAPFFAADVSVRKSGQRRELALTQSHHTMEGRDPVRSCTLAEFVRDDNAAHAAHREADAKIGQSLLVPRSDAGHQWGMAIDLTACIGCGVCTIACQAENNVPVVGKKQVLAGREMHWIRVAHYYRDASDARAGEVLHQPVPCMHCETAPCELVCPVGATAHDHEGLNDMVYNRCVGTRYCSNNCPYKVRRFNFFHYSEPRSPSLRLLQNPNVTVRERGVMEKCTYCVQRISAAHIKADREDRKIRDGEITPACAQACPTQAIVFGDLNDPDSRVRRIKASPLDYGLLAELNTRPRTTYQARVINADAGAPPPPNRERA